MPINDNYSQLTGVRSVAFIYIKPIADRSPRPGDSGFESSETFELVVYNDSRMRSADEVVVQSNITLIDSSIVDEPPIITMKLTGKNTTSTNGFKYISGGGEDDDEIVYEIYSETSLVRIEWELKGGVATDGEIDGDWKKRNHNAEPNVTDWWKPSTNNTGEYFNAPKNTKPDDPDIYEYTMTISNENGDQESTYTLVLQVVPAPVSFRPVLLFRYYRLNSLKPYGAPGADGIRRPWKVYRYVTTAFGPSDAVRAAYEPYGQPWHPSYNPSAYIAYQEDWGRKMHNEMVRIHGAGQGDNPASGNSGDGISVAWRLEGGVAFAFHEDNKPKGTYSIKKILNNYNGYRDYMAWPSSSDMYYLWAEDEIDRDLVPSNAIGNRKVYAQKSFQFKKNDDGGRTDYRLTSTGDQQQPECNDPDFVTCYETYTSDITGIYTYREASHATVAWTE
jgi:hypothetical protein